MTQTASMLAQNPFVDPHSRLLTSYETGAYLGKSARTVQRLAKLRVLPSIKIGRSLRFRLADVERALGRYQVKAVS